MGVTVDQKQRISAELEGARSRTLALLEPLDDARLSSQASPLMSPLAWDLAHVGHYEELWLLRTIVGTAPTDEHFDDVYDAFRHPRAERPSLEILGPSDAYRFVADVRARVLDALASIDLDRGEPLLRDGFVYGMVAQHEHQHDETMLATIQLMEDYVHPDAESWHPTRSRGRDDGMVELEGGRFVMGTDDAWALDNERPPHEVSGTPFAIDRAPVSNGAYASFVEDGGYDDPGVWSERGWEWRQEADLVAPQYWEREGAASWSRRRFGRREDLPLDEAVQHVCWYEADAFARWAGRRLPTEVEWERAARRAEAAGETFEGGVWEWTASDFHGYPGFEPFPYREYSEVFYGSDYKVLRGGSWACHPLVHRTSFRNWDYPIRRQIFSGFRCAQDV